ncbi:MAG: phosphoribosylanthranilate isomerase [Tepidisphaeraceae bacterium]
MTYETSSNPRVKVCCIASIEEAQCAVSLGASALGLVSAMPSGPGPIPEERIAEIAATVPPGVATFLLTCLTEADAIIAQQRRCGCNTLQLVDRVGVPVLRALHSALPGIAIVQVIHVCDADALREALEAAPLVNALLLDSGNPKLAIKELGGTGRVHDWSISRQIVERTGVPVFLAGGLKPENVADAIRAVRPYGLDICSGVRTGGKLDVEKLQRFFSVVRSAD